MTSNARRPLPRLLPVAVCALLPLTAVAAHAQLPIDGSTSGVFVNPQPGTATTTGTGTSSFTFGNGSGFGVGPSSLTFTGANFNTMTETDFLIGHLTFFNGTVASGTQIDTVDLQLGLNFLTPPVGNQSSSFTLQSITTPNTGTEDQNADIINLPASFSSSTFVVGGTSYTLQLLGFQNVVGDGFLTSNSTQFNVREGKSASADLYGRVTAAFPGAVPEPGAWAALAGMASTGGLLLLRRRRK